MAILVSKLLNRNQSDASQVLATYYIGEKHMSYEIKEKGKKE